MRVFRRWLGIGAAVIVAALAAGTIALVLMPPTLVRVGAGYSAKITCSAAFVSGRDPDQVLETDVLAPGNRLLKAFLVQTDRGRGLVRAAFLGFIAPVNAVRRPGLGCIAVPDGNLALTRNQSAPPAPGPSHSPALWPAGEGVDLSGHGDLAALLNDDALAGPGMRAIVVVKDGRIVAERYAPGFGASMPLSGWSMTKSVTGALVGTVIEAGKLSLDQDHLLPQWAGDERAKITVAQLMSMSSGLRFNEDYGDVSDVTRMLYLEPDMAAFAANEPLVATPGTTFNYSSGSTVILSRVWQDAIGDRSAALAWPRKALFGPLGMDSAVLETDEAGTFVGSSYLFATARDWARFGLFLLQDGTWNGRQILSGRFVQMMRTPSLDDPAYGKGMLWMAGPGATANSDDVRNYGLPADTYWLRGYDGQAVAIVPSARMVVVRLGLTPADRGYRPQRLVAALIKATGAP